MQKFRQLIMFLISVFSVCFTTNAGVTEISYEIFERSEQDGIYTLLTAPRLLIDLQKENNKSQITIGTEEKKFNIILKATALENNKIQLNQHFITENGTQNSEWTNSVVLNKNATIAMSDYNNRYFYKLTIKSVGIE
jgi:hypothetical protein